MTQEIPAMVVELLQLRQRMRATVHYGNPMPAWWRWLVVSAGSAVLLHLSRLAAHTRQLLRIRQWNCYGVNPVTPM